MKHALSQGHTNNLEDWSHDMLQQAYARHLQRSRLREQELKNTGTVLNMCLQRLESSRLVVAIKDIGTPKLALTTTVATESTATQV